jgi:hypothetical protein
MVLTGPLKHENHYYKILKQATVPQKMSGFIQVYVKKGEQKEDINTSGVPDLRFTALPKTRNS